MFVFIDTSIDIKRLDLEGQPLNSILSNIQLAEVKLMYK